MKVILTLQNVTKSFKAFSVLKGCSLTLEEGQIIHIKGGNGSGKSTLLYIIAGILERDGGTIQLDEKLNIGALIENPEFADYSTIKENLSYLSKLKNNFNENYIRSLCDRFNLKYDDKMPIKNFSIGMKQKLGIIQAIMENQNLLLLDEPTRGLDDQARSEFIQIIQDKVQNEGVSVIITSHEDIQELNYSKRYQLQDGVLHEIQT